MWPWLDQWRLGAGPCAGCAGLGLARPPPPHPRAAASGGGTAWVRRRSQQPRPRPLRAGGKWGSCRGPPQASASRAAGSFPEPFPPRPGPPRRLPSCAAGAFRRPRPRRPLASRPPPRFSLRRRSSGVSLRGARRSPLFSASPSEAGAGRPAWSCFPRDVIPFPVRATLRTLPAPSVRSR